MRLVGFILALVVGVALKPSVVQGVPNRPNGVLMQYFHWYSAGTDGARGLWNEVAQNASALAAKGVTALWLPPAYKGADGAKDVGYSVYDRYDLGEFLQKGSVATKYGTLAQYQRAISAAHQAKLAVIGDIVLNQMVGADAWEGAPAIEVNPANRNQDIAGTARKIHAQTLFQFPGRNGKYSTFAWHWTDFTGVDRDRTFHATLNPNAIFRFLGAYSGWQEEVDPENGNYDYLLGDDLDFRNPDVRREINGWGEWYVKNLRLDGVRMDAVKHFPFTYATEWLKATGAPRLFAVGEYWADDVDRLQHYTQATGARLSLFDVPLHDRFFAASQARGSFDLRHLLDRTWVQTQPNLAVTFVDNHDTQPLQSLQSMVADWFKPLAYAVILLRQGGFPCVFYADYFGAQYEDRGQKVVLTSFQRWIDLLLAARWTFAWGSERDYFDDANVVGWTRAGAADHPGGLAVVLNNHPSLPGQKRMCLPPTLALPQPREGAQFADLTRQISDLVVLDAQGCGTFFVPPASVSVWAPRDRRVAQSGRRF